MTFPTVNFRILALFPPHQAVCVYFQWNTVFENLKLLLRSKKDNFALKWIWISYFSRLVDSEQHMHRISHQSWRMAFSHHGIAFQKDGLAEEGLAVDSIDEFSGFGAFRQPASHDVEKTVMNGCGMAPPSCRMRWSFGFEFPARSVESGFILFNIHDLKYYMVGKLNEGLLFCRPPPF